MVNLRIATGYFPPYCGMDANMQPTGVNSYMKMLQIVGKSGINATYVYGSHFGNFDNGTYDGIMGQVYNDFADAALVYYPMDAFPPPGKYGPVLTAFAVEIVSRNERSKFTGLTFLSCLDIFSKWINISILVSLLLVALPLTRHYAHHSILAIISQMFKQNFSHLSPFSILPHLSMILWLLFIHALYGGLYTTNSVVIQPPERVDKLSDIISLNKTPIWWKGSPVKKYFEIGFTRDAAAVWGKAKQLNLSNCVLTNTQIMERLTDTEKLKQIAVILAKQSIDVALPMSCQFREKEIMNGRLRFYRSKPIKNVLSAAVLNPKLTNEKTSSLTAMFYNMFEFGLIDYFEKQQIIDWQQGVSRSECSRKLFKSDAEEVPVTGNLRLEHVLMAIVLYFLALIAIGSLLVLERFMPFGRKDASFTIKVKTIIEIKKD